MFLETLAPMMYDNSDFGWAALGAGFLLFLFIFIVAAYIYTSFAYMAIAKRVKYKSPGIAWIPGIGPMLIVSKTAKMHWWPILLLIGAIIPFIGFVFSIALAVFQVIWHWKTFEVMKRPGWWSILMLIPIVNFVIIGIVAWGKN